MNPTGKLHVSATGERDLVMTRAFDAPRRLVFDAFTKPQLLKQWLLGPDGWTLAVCEVDLRVGGAYRYVWHRERDGTDMGMGGVFREIVVPERIVATEQFDDPWYEGEAQSTSVFAEQGGKTLVTQTMRYGSAATRDAVFKSPMESGVAASYGRLERMLTSA